MLVLSNKFNIGLTGKAHEDYCMVNYKVCRIEFKAFYLIKIMQGETDYFHEDLLNYEDFDMYLPLF